VPVGDDSRLDGVRSGENDLGPSVRDVDPSQVKSSQVKSSQVESSRVEMEGESLLSRSP
jgi:hypothetical protein